MRGAVLRPGRRRPRRSRAAPGASIDEFRLERVDIRDARRRRAALRRGAHGDRAGRPHRRAALARLGGVRSADRLRGQRERHAQPARGHPHPLPRRDVHLHVDEQGLRRPAERPAAGRARHAARAARRTTAGTTGSTPTMPIDRSHALAVRRLEGRGRPAGPGVRPLLRHADRLLPRRLPDRAAARRRPAARLPRLPDAVHGHRRALHGLRLRGQAGPRQHPRPRRRRARSRPSTRPRAPAPSTTSAAAATATVSMLEAIALVRADRRPGARLDARRRGPRSATTRWWISDLDRFQRRLPGLGARRSTSRASSRDPRPERRAVDRPTAS